jgi:hypothetical protein
LAVKYGAMNVLSYLLTTMIIALLLGAIGITRVLVKKTATCQS